MDVDCRPGVERAQQRFTARRERRPDPRLSETLRTARADTFRSQLNTFQSQLNVLRVLLNVTRSHLESEPGALESDVIALEDLDQARRHAVECYERLRELEERVGQAGLDAELMWGRSFVQVAEGLATAIMEGDGLFSRVLGEELPENLRFLMAMGADENTDGRRARVGIMEIRRQIQRLEDSLEGRLGAAEEELNPPALDGIDVAHEPTTTTAGDAPFSENSVEDAPLDEATMNALMATIVDDDPLTEAEQNMMLAILNQQDTPPWSTEIDSLMSETNEPPISSAPEAITPPSPATPGTSATSATPVSGTSGIDEEMRRARDRRWEELRRRLSRHTRTEDPEERMTEE